MPLMGIVGELGCHSEDTLALTPDGIKNFKDVDIGDFVYGIDENNNLLKTEVKDKFEYDYDGDLYHISSLRYDFLVTPNHHMIFKNIWEDDFSYKQARNLTHKGHFPSQFGWEGIKQDKFNIYDYIPKDTKTTVHKHTFTTDGVERERKEHKKTIKGENLDLFDINNFLELIGWYIAEGSFTGNDRRYVQIRNYSYIDEIIDLLDEMDLNYSVYEDSKIVIYHTDLGRYFKRCGVGSYNKKIPEEIKKLHPQHLIHLFSSMFKGDGCSSNQVYYTTSSQLKEDFMELCLKLGYQPRITKRDGHGGKIKGRQINSSAVCYEVHVSFEPKNYFSVYDDGKDHYQTEHYKGKVWSFKTGSGNFFTYRNGNVQVSGNSGKTLALTYLAWRHYYKKDRNVYSNYDLYGIPHTIVDSLPKLEKMRDGFFSADELWLWLDCLEPSTLLMKNSGEIIEAKKLYEEFNNGNEVKLRGLNEEYLKNSSGNIKNARKRELSEDEGVYNIKLSNRDITVSEGHRFPVFEQNEFTIKEANELREGDFLVVPNRVDDVGERKITPTEAQVLGYIFTDGHIYTTDDIWGSEVKIDDKDKDTLEQYISLFESLEMDTRIHDYPSTVGAYTLKAGHKENEKKLEKWKKILDCGGIPKEIMTSDNEVLSSFVRGCFDGDGSVKIDDVDSYSARSGKITISNNNLQFLRQMKELLLRFGIETNRIIQTNHKGGHSYRLTIRRLGSMIRFYEEIGFDHPKRQEKLESFISGLTKGSLNKGYGRDDLIPVNKLLPELLQKIMKEYPLTELASDCDTSKIVRTDYLCHKINRKFLKKILDNIRVNISDLPEEYYTLCNIVNSDVKFKEVKKINIVEDPSFDHLIEFEVTPNRNYLANGIYVHNSRTSREQMNKVTSDILLKSRKRGLIYAFTTQSMKQIDRRVRDVMDYTCYPIMNPRETVCKLLIFQGPKPNKGNLLDKIYFKTEPVYSLYDSITGDQEVPVYIDGKLKYMRMENIADYTDKLLYVPSFDMETGEIELKEVKGYHRRYVKKDIYRVKTKYGREIKVTRDHSLFTTEGDDIVKAKVADLDYGDVIAIPRKMPSEDGGWDYLDCDDSDIYKGDLVFVPIEEISKVNHHGLFVYDFSVEDNENFIASGINASNTREEVKSLKPKSDVPFEEVEKEPRDLSEDGDDFDIV